MPPAPGIEPLTNKELVIAMIDMLYLFDLERFNDVAGVQRQRMKMYQNLRRMLKRT